MKVCLATQHAYGSSLPLALLYLKANLVDGHGHALDDVPIVELPPETPPAALAELVLAHEPAVVGLSCYVWNGETLKAVAREIRARRPDVRIVLGGPEVGPIARDVLEQEPAVDAIVRSEGEEPFAAIVAAVDAGRDLAEVPGICFRRGDAIVDTPDAAILRDLNQLPSPHQEKYATFSGRVAFIETQRGCVFRCNFCFYNKDLSIRNRRFDLDRVKREILFWLERDVHSIYLMDPVFNLNAARAKEICRFIAEHNHRRIRIHSEVWAEFMDDELAALMAEANVCWLEVGLQTTDDTTLAAIERRLRMKPFLEGLDHLKRHKIFFELQLIYGLPLETPDHFRRSLDFASRLDPPQLSVFMLRVLPGTELWRKAAEFQLEFDPKPPYLIQSHPTMSRDDIAYGWRMIEAADFLGSSRTIRLLAREPGQSMSIVLEAWNAWRAERDLAQIADARVGEFIADFCRRQEIPPAFYRAMAAKEFAADPASAAVAEPVALRTYRT